MRNWKEFELEPDLFDFWLLKYAGWVRIGPNRTYVRKHPNILELMDFMVLYDPDFYLPILEGIKNGTITEENFKPSNEPGNSKIKDIPTRLRNICESIQCEPKFFNETCIYAMAGHYCDDRRIGVANKELYKKYYLNLTNDNKNNI
jgi:hypothetical protein